jgi:hypothetical protein
VSPLPQVVTFYLVNSTSVRGASKNESNSLFFILLRNRSSDISIVDVTSPLTQNHNMSAIETLYGLFFTGNTLLQLYFTRKSNS